MESAQVNLKKVLTFWDTVSISVGQIVGAGIMALTGYAISLTGSGAPFAFVISALLMLITSIPIAVLGSAIPTTGGQYAYTSRLLGPKTGFIFVLGYNYLNIAIAMYAISFAGYLSQLMPGLHLKIAACVLITFIFLINIVGIRVAAKMENVLVVIKIVALLLFVIWGLPRVDLSVFNSHDMLPQGMIGFLSTIGVVSFATSGAAQVVELGGEMKNPHRDIPLTIIITTIIIGIFYGLIVTVDCGILPLSQVADKGLDVVAKVIFHNKLLYLFFVVGGPLFALASSLNALFAYTTKGLLVACEDGWLPRKLGEVNKRFGTPHWWLLIFYLMGIIPVIFNITLDTIVNVCTLFSFLVGIFPCFAAAVLPKKYPELYQRSFYKLKPVTLNVVVVVSVILSIYWAYLMVVDLPLSANLGSLGVGLATVLWAWYIDKKRNISKNMIDMFEKEEQTIESN